MQNKIFETKTFKELVDSVSIIDNIIENVPLTTKVTNDLIKLKDKILSLGFNIELELAKDNYVKTKECNHEYTIDNYEGSDSHHDFYTTQCRICGKIIKNFQL